MWYSIVMVNDEIKRIVDKLTPHGFELPEEIEWNDNLGVWMLKSATGEPFPVAARQVATPIIGAAIFQWLQKHRPHLDTNIHSDWVARIGVGAFSLVASSHWDTSPMDAVFALAEKAADEGKL